MKSVSSAYSTSSGNLSSAGGLGGRREGDSSVFQTRVVKYLFQYFSK